MVLASVVSAQELPKASPESVGLSRERLDRITAVMQGHVDDGRLAGAVALVARKGRVAYLQSVGMQDREKGVEMNPGTIFRIASMSKAITSVAAMMLYEEGRFQLKDPVSKFIPEFEDLKLLASAGDGSARGLCGCGDASDHNPPPADAHLGLTYHWDARVGAIYAEAGITHGLIQDGDLLAEDMAKLARLPLVHQPGEAFTYSLSTDVLGRVVEVAGGMPFDEFLRKRVFEPLRMNDTAFRLPAGKVSRLAAVYGPDSDGELRRLPDEAIGDGDMRISVSYPYEGTHRYCSGGGGLCSTVPDYTRFLCCSTAPNWTACVC
jgi:CubicO group peptidase (beta-lactamase class C family)